MNKLNSKFQVRNFLLNLKCHILKAWALCNTKD